MRILHTADTHIGTKQYNLEERRADFSRSFQRAVEIALEENVDAVVHAGDLFDDRIPTAEDLHETLGSLAMLKKAGISFLAIVGNHEMRRGVQWIDLFAKLDLAVHLGAEPFEINNIKFYGYDYAGRKQIEPLKLDGGVLVFHQLIDRVAFGDGELKLDELANCGADFVLLGDYHEHQQWRENDVLITYSGSTERWSLGEEGARGVTIVDLETKRLDRREIKGRPFLYITEEDDPIKTLDAYSEHLEGTVVCVHLKNSEHSIKAIEEHARSYGALTVRVRTKSEKAHEAEPEENFNIQLDFGNIDAMVSERLEQIDVSETLSMIDAIIRDPKIADSKVDQVVTTMLAAVDH